MKKQLEELLREKSRNLGRSDSVVGTFVLPCDPINAIMITDENTALLRT